MYVLKGRYYLIGVVMLVAAALVLTVAPAAKTGAPEKCFGKAPTLTGDSADNVLSGSDGDTPPTFDVIVGLGGKDTIEGDPEETGGERDYICGGKGK